MAKSIKVRCQGCDKQCASILIPVEFFNVLPKKNLEEILELKAIRVYCQAIKQSVYLHI